MTDPEPEPGRARASYARFRMMSVLAREVPHVPTVRAMSKVRRELFVQPDYRTYSYDNRALPIGRSQTISQPLMVAMMTAALDPQPTDRVLEVGTGSGYQAALLAEMAEHVDTVERLPELAGTAAARLEGMGYGNIDVHIARADVLGWPEGAPYDGIIVTASAPSIPQSLIGQLAPGGKLVIPVGTRTEQELQVLTKLQDGSTMVETHGECRFVPLIGPEAWPEDESTDDPPTF